MNNPDPGLQTRYEILGELSRGGMGVVYRAIHKELKTQVALKVILGGDHQEEGILRFEREAQVLSRLRHPSIVRVTDFGRAQGHPFLVMDFIEGQELLSIVEDSLKKTGSVPDFPWLCSIFVKFAEALDYCHSQKIIHRDLKPANILIDKMDRPILIDFGLVKSKLDSSLEDQDGVLTRVGTVMGTPAYMAPEQIDPDEDGRNIGPHSDIWGFGATLFHCLTGQPPYQGMTTYNIYKALISTEPPSARSINPEVPKWLDDLCLQCMSKDASQRPTAAELVERFQPERREAAPPQSFGKWAVLVALPVIVALIFALGLLFNDAKPPQLTLNRGKHSVYESRYILSGWVNKKVTLLIKSNGAKLPNWKLTWNEAEKSYSFTAELQLNLGANELTVQAVDEAGNITEIESRKIKYSEDIHVGNSDHCHFTSLRDALAKAQPGKRIILEPGTYQGPFRIDKKIEIMGATSAPAHVLEAKEDSVLSVVGGAALSLKNLTIQGNESKEEHPAIHIKDGSLSLFSSITRSQSGPGILIDGKESAAKIDSSEVVESRGHGVALLKGRCQSVNSKIHESKGSGYLVIEGELSIEGGICSRNKNNGVTAGKSAGAVVLKGVEIEGNGKNGVQLSQSKLSSIKNCKISKSRNSGIYVRDGAKVRIFETHSFKNEEGGVAAANGEIIAEQSQFHGNAREGLYLGAKTEARFKNCDIYDNKREGVQVNGSQCKIDGTSIYGNGIAGITAHYNSRLEVTGAKLYKNASGVLVRKKQCRAELRNCEIYENSGNGIRAVEHARIQLFDCTIKRLRVGANRSQGANDGVFLDSFAVCHLTNCKISEIGWNGISARHDAQLVMVNTHISNVVGSCFAGGPRGSISATDSTFIGSKKGAGIYTRTFNIRVRNCQFNGNKQHGIAANTGSTLVAENLTCSKNGEDGLLIYKQSTASIEGGHFEKNAKSGIELRIDSKMTVKKAKFLGNTLSGVSVKARSSMKLIDAVFQGNKLGAKKVEKGSTLTE